LTENKLIFGAHAIIYSQNAEADRAFLRDVLGFPSVDARDGWLIFSLPPAEVAVHPGKENNVHELYFLCEDIHQFMGAMKEKNVACSPIQKQNWGDLTQVSLPGGGKVGVYQPRHPRPVA
jgi:catechol 2,3-dioxygenase-like lactoylglutathione lyase family enzyme